MHTIFHFTQLQFLPRVGSPVPLGRLYEKIDIPEAWPTIPQNSTLLHRQNSLLRQGYPQGNGFDDFQDYSFSPILGNAKVNGRACGLWGALIAHRPKEGRLIPRYYDTSRRVLWFLGAVLDTRLTQKPILIRKKVPWARGKKHNASQRTRMGGCRAVKHDPLAAHAQALV